MAGSGEGTWARAARLVLATIASLLVVPSHALAGVNYRIIGENSGLEAVAKAQARLITSHLGIALHKELAVGYALFTKDVENAATAIAKSENGAPDRNGPTCQIAVNKKWLAAQTEPTAKQEVLAHEVFHCFEHQIAPDIVTTNGNPNASSWVIEGLARWVDLDLYPTNPDKELYGSVPYYVDHPARGLFARTYDAVGFWGHLEDVTHDLWHRIPKIIEDDVDLHDGAAFDAAVGSDRTAVLNSWGSSVFGLGPPDWTTVSPLTGSPAYPAAIPTAIDTTGGVALKPYTTAQLKLEPPSSEPLVAIHLSPGVYARFGVSENYTDKAVSDKVYCAGTCTAASVGCPGGGSSTLPPLTPLPSEPMLGVATAGIGGSADVTYFNSARSGGFCPSPGPGPGPGGGGGGGGGGSGGELGCKASCGATSGDPHMLTFSGAAYDFQAAGEFTLVKSTTDNLEIQIRQEPVPLSATVAINTAVAMRVGRHTVELALSNHGRLELWVDRQPASLTTRRLTHGGEVSVSRGHVSVSWPDKTKVLIDSGSGFLPGLATTCAHAASGALGVVVDVARKRFGQLTGLLGNPGAAASSDLVARTGTRYSLETLGDPGASTSNFDALYRKFGASWRISQRDSLFVYSKGKSTRSYTKSSYPVSALTPLSLKPSDYAKGQRDCQTVKVTDPALFEACVIDVGATGSAAFARDASCIQTTMGGPGASAGGVSPVPWTELTSQPDEDPSDATVVPSLATTGGRLLAAYPTGSFSNIEAASFTAGSTGVASVTRSDPFTGWYSIGGDIGGGPDLFAGPNHSLQMVFGGLHTAGGPDPLSGTDISALGANGIFGPAVPTGLGRNAAVGDGAVLAPDGQTPIWTATNAFGELLVDRGATHAQLVNLSRLVPGVADNPTLAYDTQGRLWLAWYQAEQSPDHPGQYMLQLDPTGDGPAPGATPLLAPDSNPNTAIAPALACESICRIVYVNSSGSGLDSWAPGQRSPTTVATDTSGMLAPTATYAPDGQLWVTWVQSGTGYVLAKLGDSSGAGGQSILLPTPSGYDHALLSSARVDGNLLVLATNWESTSLERLLTRSSVTAEFATVVPG